MNDYIYVLDKNENLLGLLSNQKENTCPYFDDLHVDMLNSGFDYYTFTVPANREESSWLTKQNKIVRQNLDGKLIMFTIMETEESSKDGVKTNVLHCESTATHDLLGQVVRPINLVSTSPSNIINQCLNGSGWTLGTCEYAAGVDINWTDYKTALKAIIEAAQLFKLDFYTEVIFNNLKIVEKKIHFVKRSGSKDGKRFEYGKDLRSITRTEIIRTGDFCTALIGTGKADANGVKLTLNNIDFTSLASYKNEFDKVKTNDYVSHKQAFQDFHNSGKHIFGVYVDDKATSQIELLVNTCEELKRRCTPDWKYKAEVIMLEHISKDFAHEKVRKGDTVIIKDTTFNAPIVLEARILKHSISYTDHTRDQVEIGEYKPLVESKDSLISKLQQQILINEAKWNNAINKEQAQAITDTTVKPVKDATNKNTTDIETARAEASRLAKEAENAAKQEASAQLLLAETRAKAHADGKVTAEEKARIKQAEDNLALAKSDASTKAAAAEKAAKEAAAMDAQTKANAARDAAINAAKLDAKAKADAAQAAAIKEASAKAVAAETTAKAHADGKVTAEEAARIKQANDNLAAAKKEAADKAAAAELAAKNAASLDAKAKADKALADAKTHAQDAKNITKGTLAAERLYGNTIDAQKANIVNINAERINGGTFTAGGKNGVEGVISVQDATGKEHTRMDHNGIVTNKLTLTRPDGYKVINDGLVSFDFAVEGCEPPFAGNGLYQGVNTVNVESWWLTTIHSSFQPMNFYTYRHTARYLKIHLLGGSDGGGGQVIEVVDRTGKIVMAQLSHGYWIGNGGEGFEITVDLGIPTGKENYFYIKFRSQVQGVKTYIRKGRIWLEG